MAVYIVEQSYIDFLTSQNVTGYVKGRDEDGYPFDDPMIAGTELNRNNEVYFIAGDGFEFELIGSDNASIYSRSPMGGFTYCKYDFENPSRAFEKVGYSYQKVSNVTLIESYDDVDTKGVNDVFLITDSTMRGVINANFNLNDGQTTKDYGQYLLGLVDIPFTIDPEFIKFVDSPIKLASYDTGFKGSLLKNDILTVNLGTILTPKTKDNFLDFSNKTTLLHLPYSEPIALETQYVIGETISIEYQINLYSGLTVINISSTKIGGVIATRNVDLNVSVPFGSVTSQPSKNDPRNVDLGGDNGVKTAYIEMLSNDAILENGFFTIPIIDETIINTCAGFIKVDEINLVSKATSNEKNMIVSLLSGGVIV